MLENTEISGVIEKLTKEFDVLIEEREDVRIQTHSLKTRADELDRKIAGIQKTLQGLSLYGNAQEEPPELMKQTLLNLDDMMKKVANAASRTFAVAGPNVRKTLTECCRDILRKKQDWMTPIEIRDALLAAGFDFSNYTSNPLSSIHTTIKRMVPDDVITETQPERGQVYRWKTIEIDVDED
jgi:hypothetical protein